MAKKRVHEVAKERGISSKEVIATLQSAGFNVKAAASSVDERDIQTAFNGGTAAPAEGPRANGAPAVDPSRISPTAPPTDRGGRPNVLEGGRANPPAAGDPGGPRAGEEGPPGTGNGGAAPADGQRAPSQGGGSSSQRPGRSGRLGEQGGAAGRRRRVVIEGSQAARPRGGPAPSQQPPRRGRGRRRRTPWVEPDLTIPAPVQEEPTIQVHSGATVKEVAESLGLSAGEVIKKLMQLGEMATLTQTLPDETIELLASELDKKIEIVSAADEAEAEVVFDDADEDLVRRPPVVTVMGHVDHGKTSLLDAIRSTEVVSGEAGGITQHIGAYQVHVDDQVVTFLDTPGHQAFTAMRARGAKVTDLAVIVVAADDGVMPQTEEAIDHARAADVPVLIAVNKIDKEGADPNRVRGELAGRGLTPADWGGDTEFVDVSARTRDGLDSLLENITTISDLLELRSNPTADMTGTVIESRLDPGRGPVVSILIQRGTLEVGDALVSGAHWGRVRAMHDYRGQKVAGARPGEPVEILGFDGVPEAGEPVRQVENERVARTQAADRANRLKTEAIARRQGVKVKLEDVFRTVQAGRAAHLNLVVKADVAGSLEALADEVARLPQDQVAVNLIHEGVGGINESDVMLASASDAIVIGFNVRPVQDARQIAEREGVEIRTYSVIYQALEEMRQAMEGLLEPEEVEQTLGTAEVRQTFRASRIGIIAGCYVRDGLLRRNARLRVVRDGTVVIESRIGSLRRFSEDAREVEAGYECGVVVENFGDLKEGDVLEAFETRQVERVL